MRRAHGVLTAVCLAASAWADDSSDIAAARAFGTEGVMLADRGNCADAIDKLSRAETLHHAPTTAERLGECEIEVGRIVAGTERLQRLLRESLPSGAPTAFLKALERADRVLKAALPRIAMLRLMLIAPPDAKPSLSFDGAPLPSVFVGHRRPTDP